MSAAFHNALAQLPERQDDRVAGKYEINVPTGRTMQVHVHTDGSDVVVEVGRGPPEDLGC